MGTSAADSLSLLLEQLSWLPRVSFDAPERVWLAAPVLLVLLLAPLMYGGLRRGAWLPLAVRCLVLLALAAVVLEPTVEQEQTRKGRLLVLADVSPSIGASGLEQATAFLRDARAPFDLVAFGATPELVGEQLAKATLHGDPRDATDLAAALRMAAARAAGPDPLRVVLLSDGRPTRPGTEDAALALRGDKIELWARSVPERADERKPHVRVKRVELPPMRERVRPFSVSATVETDGALRAKATLYLDGVAHASRTVSLAKGGGRVVFDKITLAPGRYHAQVMLEGDSSPLDNVGSAPLEVPGTPRVLLLGRESRDSLLAQALRKQEMQADVRGVAAAGELDSYDAVVLLPDAPADELDRHAAALTEFVGRRGGGLVAVGGTEGPGLARLYGRPTAQLLPLEVEPRPGNKPPPKPKPGREPRIEVIEEKTQAYPITLCLVVDRSGSMRGRKMAKAKAAAAAAAGALTPEDRVAVVAFGTATVVAMQPRRAGDPRVVQLALSGLQAAGQTSMYRALSVGYALLLKESSAVRHLVLLSDGRPTDDGHWRDLVTSMAKRNITTSAVGIGFDIDSHLMGRIATWGQGRYWLADKAFKVPQIVTMDTRAVIAFRDKRGEDAEKAPPAKDPQKPPEPEPEKKPKPAPTKPPEGVVLFADPSAPREMLKGIPDAELPKVAGVEEGKTRLASWVAARAGEGGPPVAAYWRVGLGTAAVLAVDPEAPGSRELREHKEFPRIIAQLLRSVLPDTRGEPFLVEHELRAAGDEDRLTVRVIAEDGLPRTDLPVGVTLDGRALEVLRRGSRFEVTLPPGRNAGRVNVRVGPAEKPLMERGLAVPAARNPEHEKTGPDRALLLRLAGAAQRLDPSAEHALVAPERTLQVVRPVPLPFLLLAAILLPLDAWVRRRAKSASR